MLGVNGRWGRKWSGATWRGVDRLRFVENVRGEDQAHNSPLVLDAFKAAMPAIKHGGAGKVVCARMKTFWLPSRLQTAHPRSSVALLQHFSTVAHSTFFAPVTTNHDPYLDITEFYQCLPNLFIWVWSWSVCQSPFDVFRVPDHFNHPFEF